MKWGELRTALPHAIRYARIRPHDIEANIITAGALAGEARQVEEGGFYAELARNLLKDFDGDGRQGWALAPFFPVQAAQSSGDLEAALIELELLLSEYEAYPTAVRKGLDARIFHFYLALGKNNGAEEWLQNNLPGDDCSSPRSALMAARHDLTGLRLQTESCLEYHDPPELWVAMKALERGVITDHDYVTALVDRYYRSPGRMQIANKALHEFTLGYIEAHRAYKEGDYDEAIPLLRENWESLGRMDASWFSPITRILVSMYEKEGNLDEATALLEKTIQRRREAFFPFFGWQITEQGWQLFQLYRAQGRLDEAEQTRQLLRDSLHYADPDHPVLLQLDQEHSAASR
jgi:hypothetical protein